MSDREALEKQATELGITFPPNIKDQTLKSKIEKAQAAKAEEKTAQTPAQGKSAETPGAGSAPADNTGDQGDSGDTGKKLTETPKPASPGAGGAEDSKDVDTLTVFCAVTGGRRRAGRRFNGGENRIPVSELDAEAIEQIAADPMLSIRSAPQE